MCDLLGYLDMFTASAIARSNQLKGYDGRNDSGDSSMVLKEFGLAMSASLFTIYPQRSNLVGLCAIGGTAHDRTE